MARRVIPGALWLALLGCFSEQSSPSECDAGTPGCACAAGACDPGYECAAEVDLCVPTGCDPGTRGCTCAEGGCVGELSCNAGVCGDADATGTGNASTTPADTSATASDVTGPPDTGATATDASDTTGMTTAMTSDASSSGGAPDGAACLACFMETTTGTCAADFEPCSFNTACNMLAACVSDCLANDDPACISPCCTGNPGGEVHWEPLAGCAKESCQAACGDWFLTCGGG